MTHTATTLSKADWKQLDARIRQVDEERWLSSRYAGLQQRQALVALYGLNYELARIRLLVTEPGMGAIRFQWWRDALDQALSDRSAPHQVVLALREQVETGMLNGKALHKLINGHEDAFEAQDRAKEPEAHLAAMASKIFAPAHGWGQVIVEIAPHWAALRRGEAVGFGPVVAPAPQDIRPAVAHFRLRRMMAKDDQPGQLARRMCVMRAMFSGAI